MPSADGLLPDPRAHLTTGIHAETERDVLGALMNFPQRAPEWLASLRPDSFAAAIHRAIHGAIAGRVRTGQPAAFVDLMDLPALNQDEATRLALGNIASSYGYSDYGVPDRITLLNRLADLRALRVTLRKLSEAAAEPGDRTAAQIVAEAQAAVLELGTQHAGGAGLVAAGKGIRDVIEKIDRRGRTEGGGLRGFRTRFTELNMILSGLQRKKVYVVAGRPAMGKSVFAMNLVEDVARYNADQGKVLLFTLEMDLEEVQERLLGAIAGVDGDTMSRGRLTPDQWDKLDAAAGWVESSTIEIDDTAGLDLGTLTARVHQAKARGRIAAVAVDYIGLMELEEKKGENTAVSLARLSKGIKRLAKTCDVAVILLVQLNRDVEKREGLGNKKPRMSDLRDSGGLEQDADVILFPHRPERFDKDPAWKGFAELVVEKQRGGKTGSVPAGFEGQCFRFTDTPPRAALERFHAPEAGGRKGQTL